MTCDRHRHTHDDNQENHCHTYDDNQKDHHCNCDYDDGDDAEEKEERIHYPSSIWSDYDQSYDISDNRGNH